MLTVREGFVLAAGCCVSGCVACPPVVLCTFDGNDCVVCAAKNVDGSSLLVVLDKLVSNGVVLLLAELELAFDRVFFVLLRPFLPPTTIGL